MQARWMTTPWMRRRMERYIQRGTSERMIAYLMPPNRPGSTVESREAGSRDWPPESPDLSLDLSNVILFRALAGAARPGACPEAVAPAHEPNLSGSG